MRLCAIDAASWKPERISLSLPGYQLMSPIAKTPGTLVSKLAVSTGMSSLLRSSFPNFHRSELHGEPKERQYRIAGNLECGAVFVFTIALLI